MIHSNLTTATEFISPPTTPKLQMDSFHGDSWDSSSTTSSASSIVCHSPTSSYYSRRKQRPMQSLPKSTKGTFHMPIFVPTSPAFTTNSIANQHSSTSSPLKKRKHKHVCDDIQSKSTQSEKIPYITSVVTNNTLVSSNEQFYVQPQFEKKSIANNIEDKNASRNEGIKSEEQNLDAIHHPITDPSKEEQIEEDGQTLKKAKTSAAYIYDSLSADIDQSVLFKDSEEWIPKLDVFNKRPAIRISWKGSPLKIRNMPYFEKLHAGEVSIAATLRLTPEQYLKCKWALVLAAKEASENDTLFRKSEAQKVCCIDVNKTSVLWHAFGKLGWLGSKWPQ